MIVYEHRIFSKTGIGVCLRVGTNQYSTWSPVLQRAVSAVVTERVLGWTTAGASAATGDSCRNGTSEAVTSASGGVWRPQTYLQVRSGRAVQARADGRSENAIRGRVAFLHFVFTRKWPAP